MGKHTEHGGHDSHAGVRLVLVRTADTEVVDAVETQRVEASGHGTFRRHGGQ